MDIPLRLIHRPDEDLVDLLAVNGRVMGRIPVDEGQTPLDAITQAYGLILTRAWAVSWNPELVAEPRVPPTLDEIEAAALAGVEERLAALSQRLAELEVDLAIASGKLDAFDRLHPVHTDPLDPPP